VDVLDAMGVSRFPSEWTFIGVNFSPQSRVEYLQAETALVKINYV